MGRRFSPRCLTNRGTRNFWALGLPFAFHHDRVRGRRRSFAMASTPSKGSPLLDISGIHRARWGHGLFVLTPGEWSIPGRARPAGLLQVLGRHTSPTEASRPLCLDDIAADRRGCRKKTHAGVSMFKWLWVKTNGTIVGVGAPPILVYFSGWIGMFTGVRGFDPWPNSCLRYEIGRHADLQHQNSRGGKTKTGMLLPPCETFWSGSVLDLRG